MAQARGGFDLVLDLLRATARDLLVPGCVGGGVAVSSSPVSSSRANSRMV
jgi:imidazole glycerol phosphate synthase subunit HisF